MCSLLVHDMYMTGKLEYSTYVYRILVRVNQEGFYNLSAFLHTYIYVWRDAQTAQETFEIFKIQPHRWERVPVICEKGCQGFKVPLVRLAIIQTFLLTRAYCERYDSPRKATNEQKGLTGSRDILRICGMNPSRGGVGGFCYLRRLFYFLFLIFFFFFYFFENSCIVLL